jgi:LacI family transcriptional regulator
VNNKGKVTIKDVAKAANVSIATVSYIINNSKKMPEETRAKVNEVIKELGYEPNMTARSLVKKESRAIAIIMPMKEKHKKSILTENPFFQEFIFGVEYRARELGYTTLIMGVDSEEKCLKLIQSGNLAGIVVLGYLGKNKYKLLSNVSVPVVIVDQEKSDSKFIYIITEDERGAFLAVEHLISKGHKNIALLTGSIYESPVYKNRFEGYRKALEKHNIEVDKKKIFECSVSYEGGIKSAKQIKDRIQDITAVFCTADIIALGLIKGLHRAGIEVPVNLSIVGFDNIRNSKYFIPELTTVSQQILEKGEKAVDLIYNALNSCISSDNNECIIPVSIVERESVGTVKSKP